VVSEAFDDELRPGYGFRIECPPALPGILAASVPWWGSARHLGEMSRAPRTAAFILIARDAGGGEVRVNRQGEPVVSYGLSSEIQDLLTRAMTQGARIHWAAGATRVATLHTPPLAFDSGEGNAEAIRRRGVSPNRVSLFSAHQMASCRIGVDRESSVANPEGQVWDVPNLYIADASAFPVSSGVNPMLTVMALARRTAQRMP
jgi:choline dehydrogenase-like flavoprotein